MQFSPEFIDQLKTLIPLADLVSKVTPLQQKGRTMTGCCPFHKEKTPSFYVYPDEGSYHCYGCKAHGDIISFVQNTQGLDFQATIEFLANLAGIPIPQEQQGRGENTVPTDQKNRLLNLMEATAQFYEKTLWSNAGSSVRRYLTDRTLTPETLREFRLGYAPGGDALTKHLLAQGFTHGEMLTLRIIGESQTDGHRYEFFRNRLMFPICDRQGHVIAFGGRTLSHNKNDPKYINSSESPIYHKGHVLYAYHHVQKYLKESPQIIVCEGYMDVIALHQAGFKGAVAPLGTALTENQLQLLWRITNEPLLCFDGDQAGQKAAESAVKRAVPILKPGKTLGLVYLPQGEDPDSLMTSGKKDVFQKILKAPEQIQDFLWRQAVGLYGSKGPHQQAQLEKYLMDLAQQIQDPTSSNKFKSFFKSQCFDLFRTFKPNKGKESPAKVLAPQKGLPPMNAGMLQEDLILATYLHHPWIMENNLDDLMALEFRNPRHNDLKNTIISYVNDGKTLDIGSMHHHLYNEGFTDLVDRLLDSKLFIHGAFLKPKASQVEVLRGLTHLIDMFNSIQMKRNETLALKEQLKNQFTSESWDRMKAIHKDMRKDSEIDS